MKYFLLILIFFITSCSPPKPGTETWFKEKHKELKAIDPEVEITLGEFKEDFSISTHSQTNLSKEQIINKAIWLHSEGKTKEAELLQLKAIEINNLIKVFI